MNTCPLVYIVILSWNGREKTMACLTSVFASSYPNFRVLVVDNASSDDSVSYLRTLGEKITLLENAQNLGFTGGCNCGISHAISAGADYVWLLNNDATVDAETLTQLVAACEADACIGLASPIICVAEPAGKVEFAGGRIAFTPWDWEFTTDPVVGKRWQAGDPEAIGVYGTAMLIRRRLIKEVGVLDDRYFAYWEDVDYSIRSIKAGFRNLVVFGSSVCHWKKPVPLDVGRAPYFFYFMTRNEILLCRAHCSGMQLLRALIWNFYRTLGKINRVRNNPTQLHAYYAGLWDGWRGVSGPYRAEARMPRPLQSIVDFRPMLWRHLLDGRILEALKEIFRSSKVASQSTQIP